MTSRELHRQLERCGGPVSGLLGAIGGLRAGEPGVTIGGPASIPGTGSSVSFKEAKGEAAGEQE